MAPSTTITGVITGVITSLLLIPALYLDVPRAYISDWTAVSREVGLVTTLLAAVVWVLCGMLAAFLRPERPIHSGALAGFIAGALSLLCVGLTAAGVMAHGDLISSLETGRATTLELKRGIAVSAVLVPFYQTVAGVALLGAGTLLGWMGGVIQDLWKGVPTRHTPTIRPSPVPWLGLATGLLAVPALLAGILTVEQMLFEELGGTSTWIGQAQLTSPLLLGAVLMAGCLFVIARDAVIVRRAGQGFRAIVWLLTGVALMGIQAMIAVPVYWQVLITPGGWGSVVLMGGGLLTGLIAGTMSTAEPATTPRTFGEIVAEAILCGVLMALLVAIHGTSAGMLIGLISAPWVEVITGGASAIDTQTAAGALDQAYIGHLSYPALAASTTVSYVVIAVPVWLVAAALRNRR